MTDARIRIVTEIVGAEQAAEAIGNVATAVDEVAEAERRAIEFTSAYEGALAEERAQVEALAQAHRSAGEAHAALDGAARESTQRAIEFTTRLAGAASAVAGLAASIGGESEAAGLVARVAQLSAAGAQLGNSFGPQGALVGGIAGLATATIPALIEALFGVPEAQEAVEDSTRDTTSAIQAQERATRDATAALTDFLAQASTAGRRREVQGQEEVLRGLLEQRDALLRTGRAVDVLEARGVEDEIRNMQAAIASQLDTLQQEEREIRTAQERRAGGGAARRAEAEAEREFQRAIADTVREYNALAAAAARAKAEEQERLDEIERKEETIDRLRERRQEEFARRSLAQLQREQRERTEALDRETERREEELAVFSDLATNVSRGVVDAVSAIASGSKTAEEAFKGMLASFLSSIAEMALIEAAKEYAAAIASFARYDFGSGAQHIAAGVAYTGVAIATGAAAGAIMAPPAAGGGPERPDAARPSGDGGRVVNVVNWNAPAVVAGSEAEAGRTLDRLGRRASQRFGRLAS